MCGISLPEAHSPDRFRPILRQCSVDPDLQLAFWSHKLAQQLRLIALNSSTQAPNTSARTCVICYLTWVCVREGKEKAKDNMLVDSHDSHNRSETVIFSLLQVRQLHAQPSISHNALFCNRFLEAIQGRSEAHDVLKLLLQPQHAASICHCIVTPSLQTCERRSTPENCRSSRNSFPQPNPCHINNSGLSWCEHTTGPSVFQRETQTDATFQGIVLRRRHPLPGEEPPRSLCKLCRTVTSFLPAAMSISGSESQWCCIPE